MQANCASKMLRSTITNGLDLTIKVAKNREEEEEEEEEEKRVSVGMI